MSEFLGARISLVSRSDIRYVGTLHEINSEASTVALENVSSFGTEGRKENPEEEIAPSDSVYEYIVFRGSDVKDLRIEEKPAEPEPKRPQVPNDPAILGGTRPAPQALASQGPSRQAPNPQQGPSPPAAAQQQQQGPPPGVPPFAQHQQFPPPFYPPPPAGWGRAGPPGPAGYPGMPPFGAPPGWYPPPGQGFQPFPYGYPPPPGQFQQGQQGQPSKPAPIGPGANKQAAPGPPAQPNDKQGEPKSLAKPAEMAAAAVQKVPTPPTVSKPSPPTTQATESKPSTSQNNTPAGPSKLTPSGPKNNNRIQPALPLQSPAAPKAPLANVSSTTTTTDSSLKDATAAATAAVAAAMAKLPPAGGQANGNNVDNLSKKVNEMRVNEPTRTPRQPTGAGGFNTGRAPRGGRGGARGGAAPKVEVPATDFDFAESNAKFNKQELVKEAIGSEEHVPEASPEPEAPVGGYNKSTSFFDNISSESKDRADAGSSRPGGREWRGEEQKKNLETFGQGSVDNGYRGGYRGRGRGRGYRGRGYGGGQTGRGRGGYRGRGDAQTVVQ